MPFRFTGFADEAGKTLADQIAVTNEAGWSSIELRLIDGKNVCDMTPDEWGVAWQTLQDAGITVAGFGGQIANWARPITTDFNIDLDEIQRVAPYMREAGTPLIRIMSYPNDKENPVPEDEWKTEVLRRLKELAKVAHDHGVVLGHENCSGWASGGPDQTLEMIAEVDSPALKLIFDTGNHTVYEKDPEYTWNYYKACRDHIVHVHIKAAKPGDNGGDWVMCYPDEDPVQERIIKDLEDTGYDGWLSIEPHMAAAIHAGKDVTDPDFARNIYLEYAKRIEAIVDGVTASA